MTITDRDILRLYYNKTVYILVPYYVQTLGSSITKLFNKAFKVAIGLTTIENISMNNYKLGDISILINKHYSEYYYKTLFSKLEELNVIRQLTLYSDDLILLTINNSQNKSLLNKYELFLQGKYSEMYSAEEQNYYFRPSCKLCQIGLSIINKDLSALKMYEEEIREVYNIKNFSLSPDEYVKLPEGALPPVMYKEVIGSESSKFVKDVIQRGIEKRV